MMAKKVVLDLFRLRSFTPKYISFKETLPHTHIPKWVFRKKIAGEISEKWTENKAVWKIFRKLVLSMF
jgi:hypothetical protein